mgnify:CR=1 FL=1
MHLELDDRHALASHILDLEFPGWAGAWLKAIVAPEVREARRKLAAGEVVAGRRMVVHAFLEDHFNLWTPEDAPYTTFLRGAWRPVAHAEMIAGVDHILGAAARRIAERRSEEAHERAEAEAGGYSEALGPSVLDGTMIDLAALRRWFTHELWGPVEPTWFTNMGPGIRDEPAVIGVDEDIVAILWLP